MMLSTTLCICLGLVQTPLSTGPVDTLTGEEVQSKTELIESFFVKAHELGLFHGAVIIVEAGETVYESAFGVADDAGRSLSLATPFYLASVSKQFTATAIMLLNEEGLLEYDAPLSDYFPELPEWSQDVTVEHLLTHTSGLGDLPRR